MNDQNRVNCWGCRHFATSWEPRRPYLCKLLGFKSRVLPCLEVVSADGKPCLGFSPKQVVPTKPPRVRVEA